MGDAIPTRIGKYEILSVLGEGGMGVVYKARDPLLDRTVAVKTIRFSSDEVRSELLARLMTEAKSAARLQHPNIVTVFELGLEKDLPYIAMEYVEGANLARLIEDHVPLSLETKVDLVMQLCDALSYAHGLGVLHRDIKPSNICVTRLGAPKLLDFGLARFDETRLTRTGMTSGTVAYISPERMQGDSGTSDDVFALGAVAFEIFTGTRAFPGKTYGEVVRNMLSGDYPLRPSELSPLPRELDEILFRATDLERAKRYSSADELRSALAAFRASPAFAQSLAAQPPLDENLATVMLPRLGENPYSAPEIEDRMSDPGMATAPIRKDAIAAAGAADSFVSRKTEIDRPAVIPPGSEERTGPTTAYSATSMTAPTMAATVLSPPAAGATPADASSSTVVTSIRSSFAKALGAEKSSDIPRTLLVAFAVLGASLLAAPLTLTVGGPPAYLVTVAFAVGAWIGVIHHKRAFPITAVLFLALLLRVLTWVSEPAAWSEVHAYQLTGATTASWTNPYERTPEGTTSPHGPHAELLFVGWMLSGGGVMTWRLLLTALDLLIVAMLWKQSGARNALAYACFPIVILEGVWNGNVQLVASTLLIASLVLLRRRHGWSAAAAIGAAGGISLTSLAALPVIRRFTDSEVRTLIIATLAFLPGIAFFAGSDAAVVGHTLRSDVPWYAALASALADQLRRFGITTGANELLSLRGLELPALLSDLEMLLAVFVLLLAMALILSFFTRRAKSIEAAATNSVGLVLLFSGAATPWSWLLLVPAAILSDQAVWIFVAVFAQLLYAGNGAVSTVGVYLLPLMLLIVLRLQRGVARNLGLVFEN